MRVLAFASLVAEGCSSDESKTPTIDPTLAAQGKEIFRFDTFGDETFWTDTLAHARGHPGRGRSDDRALRRA